MNGMPFAVVLSKGKFLRNEKIKREVRVGRYYLDFGNDLYYGLEIDGAAYHTDVVAAFERDSYIYQRGWRVMHIPALWVWTNPNKVQRMTMGFLLYGK